MTNIKTRFGLLVAVVAAAGISVAVATAPPPAAAAGAVSVVGHISGGGTANMTDLPAGMGVSSFGFEATLYSDGSARGHFDCVDHMGDVPGYPGNIFGDITGWSLNPDGSVSLQITDGKFVAIPGGLVVPGGLPFTVTIQRFGGAGVGHWTLDVPGVTSPFNGGPICQELLISGRIVAHWN